ncbi:hypothetical protein DDZ13_12650 [Coraliomargarita sinensis]|uniref:PEP-CTERM protein-sorting domain-containing protein n=1 Tax=Coraliomargarita sinensis TaxID=2174842 RepID=A0A317ZHN0_9BACT|nr:hypothetical protein [Coraliomargarita sinensis]PXA03269.1 hypothetical protein DDZ13_12650 [Coraliomargarita sinensis]
MSLIRKTLIFLAGGALVCAATANANEIFRENFEFPNVTETTEPKFTSERRPGAWVVGPINPDTGNLVYGAERQGIVDAVNNAFSASVGNNQAYAFRYTASPQIVSSEAAFRITLEEGSVYTLSFDVQQDRNDNEDPSVAMGYDAYILAFNPGADRGEDLGGKKRDMPDKEHTILGQATGTVDAGPSFSRVTLTYTGLPADSEHFGKDIGIAFKDLWMGNPDSNISSGVIDNINFTVDRIPEPSALVFGILALCAGFRRRCCS